MSHPDGTVGAWRRAALEALCHVQSREDAAREARLILQEATGWSAARCATADPDDMPPDAQVQADAMVLRRKSHEPLSQILGAWSFYGRDFVVSPHVLTPRPDTETLIDVALEQPFSRLLDLGTGSGAIAITLLAERPCATGLATDLSLEALEVAGRNAAALGVDGRLRLMTADWFAGLVGQFDLIVSNPPYITAEAYGALDPTVRDWEPRLALTPGGDGLSPYRKICCGASGVLAAGGRLMVEIGHDQGEAVAALLEAAGLADVRVHPDINGKDRVVSGLQP